MQRVLPGLKSKFVANRPGSCGFGAAKASTLVSNNRFYGGEQFSRGHYADRDTRPAENSFNDFAVTVARNNDAVLHIVTANDAARRHAQVEYRVAGRGELVDHLARRRAAVEDAGIAFFQNHHAAALDTFVVGIDGRSHEVGETDVSDEASALFDLQNGLIT